MEEAASGEEAAAGCPTPSAGGASAATPAEGEAAAAPAESEAATPAEGEAAAAPAEGEAAAAAPAQGGAAASDPAAVEAGQALFVGKLGCYGCHGQDGGGGMGPALNDSTWIYGGDEAAILETLHNGRPGGMPAFGNQASEEELQQVAAFVTSLSK